MVAVVAVVARMTQRHAYRQTLVAVVAVVAVVARVTQRHHGIIRTGRPLVAVVARVT